MLSLKGRQDKYRILLPDELIPETLNEKYSNILKKNKSYIYKPIDLLNESIQRIQVLGITNGTVPQGQTGRGSSDQDNNPNNYLLHTSSDYTYRAVTNPLALIDKTMNIEFKHSQNYLNYFLIFECFFYQHERDTNYESLSRSMFIDIFNEAGETYSRIVLFDPLIDGIDMLDLDFTQPVASSQTFRVSFKYSNIDFQFLS